VWRDLAKALDKYGTAGTAFGEGTGTVRVWYTDGMGTVRVRIRVRYG